MLNNIDNPLNSLHDGPNNLDRKISSNSIVLEIKQLDNTRLDD